MGSGHSDAEKRERRVRRETAMILGGVIALQVARIIGMFVLLNIYYIWPLVIGFDNGYGRQVWTYPMFTLMWGVTSLVPLLMFVSKRARNTLFWTKKSMEKEVGDRSCLNLYDSRILTDQLGTFVYDFVASTILTIASWYIWDYIRSKPGYPGSFKNYVPSLLMPLETAALLPAGTVGTNSIGDIISFVVFLCMTMAHVMIVSNDVLKTAMAAFFGHPQEWRLVVPNKLLPGNDDEDYDEWNRD